MARERPVIEVGWFLTEWMDRLGVRQSEMIERTGWSKTTASHLYNRRQDYNPGLVKQAAHALGIEPFELLLHPDDAIAIRQMRESAFTLARAAEPRSPFRGFEGGRNDEGEPRRLKRD